ncbi:MAG: hypothetical protein E7235_06810 [Lachnospiraceae bacterium]|nr:hypothetical protein [Lachnospiraceae bacterium]
MKEEIMKVLSLLENGVINAEEADKLIKTINGDRKERSEAKEKVVSNLQDAFSKVGEGLGGIAKVVGEKAEKVAQEAKPVIKKMGEKVGDAAEELAEKAKNIKKAREEKKNEEPVDAEAQEVTTVETESDDDDFIKDDRIVIMPSESFSSKDME